MSFHFQLKFSENKPSEIMLSFYFTFAEQEMERKVQEHKQELERLQQATKLDKQKLIHEAKLKKEAATVSLLMRMIFR